MGLLVGDGGAVVPWRQQVDDLLAGDPDTPVASQDDGVNLDPGDVVMGGELVGGVGVGDAPDGLGLVGRIPILNLMRRAEAAPDERLTPSWLAAAQHYMKDKVHLNSLAMEARTLGLTRKDLRNCRATSAGLSVEVERYFWSSIEERVAAEVASGNAEILTYLEYFQYDGVDVVVSTKQVAGMGPDLELEPEEGEDPDVARAEIEHLWREMGYDVEKGPAKVLNSLHMVALLVRRGSQFMILHNSPITWLQCLDRNTGETLRHGTDNIRVGSEGVRDLAARRVRLTITDSAGYNLRAERNHRRSADTPVIHLLCDVHIVSNIHKKTFSLVQSVVQGTQRVSTSLQGGGTMTVFRKACRRVLAKELELIYIEPNAEAKAFKASVLHELCGSDVEFAPLRLALGKLASGDWRVKNTFQYLAKPHESRRSVLLLLFKELVPLLLGHVPFGFPTHRWTGADKSLRDVGLLGCIHNLLQSVYAEFMNMMESHLVTHGRRAGGDDARHGGDVGGAYDASVQPEDLPQHSAEAKRHYRGAANQWIQTTNTARDMMTMSVALDPIASCMHSQLQSSSSEWTTEQHYDRATFEEQPEDIKQLFARTSWPLLLASNLVIDREFLNKLREAHDVARFDSWPAHWRTMETQSLLFRLLSRQGAGVKENLVVKHRDFPYLLFRLLGDDSSAKEEIESRCDSSKDAYTESFFAYFGDDIESPAALSELAMIVTSASTNTASLESSNASLRRRMNATGVQVNLQHLEHTSAEFYLGKLRRRGWEAKFPAGHEMHWKAATAYAKKDQKPKGDSDGPSRGGGGPWRAFLSERGLYASAEASRLYRALPDHEMERLRKIGEIRTDQHRYGVQVNRNHVQASALVF